MRSRPRPARAGLQFIILTDHGDGTRAPDAPAYRSGVLTIDGVELNTTGGHYAAIGLPASPYPIAGTPADVIEDVRRLGGFGIRGASGIAAAVAAAGRTGTRRSTASSGSTPTANGATSRACRSRARLLTYLLRAPESMATLLDRPDGVLRQWDELDGDATGGRPRRHRRACAARVPPANRSGRARRFMCGCRATSRRFARSRITSRSTRRCRATPAADAATDHRCDSQRPRLLA